jgi:lipopolysaccharide export system protein LptC
MIMSDVENTSDAQSAADGQRADRLRSLNFDGQARTHSKRYSVFIKSLRVALPLVALCMVVLLFVWDDVQSLFEDDVALVAVDEPASKVARVIGKNELLNPRFESVDEDGNPYIVTAKRALQGQSSDDDLIILEEPVADVALSGGQWLAVKAEQSAFRQGSQRLLLKGNVEMFHDEGYTLYTQEMDVDMKAGSAQTSTDVHVQGPKGVLDAKGLKAQRLDGTLIFKGPAKLVLSGEGL